MYCQFLGGKKNMYCQFLGGKKTIICTEYHLSLEKDFFKKYCSTPIMLALSQKINEIQCFFDVTF
jgi:hypothetical protein